MKEGRRRNEKVSILISALSYLFTVSVVTSVGHMSTQKRLHDQPDKRLHVNFSQLFPEHDHPLKSNEMASAGKCASETLKPS